MAAGRPTKLTSDVHNQIVAAVRAGNYMETAAAYAGINKDTLYRWLRRGAKEKERVAKDKRTKVRKEEQPFVEFSDAVKKALAEAEMRDVLVISKAADGGQWQASAWRLERKFPDRWGHKAKIQQEISGPGGQPVSVAVDLSVLTDEELRSLESITKRLEHTAR
jgi:transposase